jgi:hypothetical protein
LKKESILNYSLQLAMLSKLLSERLISTQEYTKIRQKLMKKYGVISEITINMQTFNKV